MNRSRALFGHTLLAVAAFGLAAVASCTPKFTAHDARVPANQSQLNRTSLRRIAAAEDSRRHDLLKEAETLQTAKTSGTVKSSQGSPQNSLKVGIVTDSHNDYEDFEKVVSLLNGHADLDFVLLIGDFTNVGMIWEYDQAWKVMKNVRAPLGTVQGNHDAVGFGKDIYNDMFGATDFGFSVKGVRFVVWANAKLEYERTSHRFDALTRELAMPTDAQKTIVVSHIPPTESESQIYSTAEKNEFHGILKSHSATVSLHGHMHARGRQRVDGIDYVTVQRVRGVNYSIMTVEGGAARFEHCSTGGCESTPEPTVSGNKWH